MRFRAPIRIMFDYAFIAISSILTPPTIVILVKTDNPLFSFKIAKVIKTLHLELDYIS